LNPSLPPPPGFEKDHVSCAAVVRFFTYLLVPFLIELFFLAREARLFNCLSSVSLISLVLSTFPAFRFLFYNIVDMVHASLYLPTSSVGDIFHCGVGMYSKYPFSDLARANFSRSRRPAASSFPRSRIFVLHPSVPSGPTLVTRFCCSNSQAYDFRDPPLCFLSGRLI